MSKPRDVPRPFTMPWGRGEIIEEATADHRGRFKRSPLMVSSDTIAGLSRSLAETPRLRGLLGKLVAAKRKPARTRR